MKKKVVIVGAGMTGLTAANDLVAKGFDVVVLDKGRGVGGRLATRRLGTSRADHGAQYIAAKTPVFQAFLSDLQKQGTVQTWQVNDRQHQRFVGTQGMSGIAKAMSANLRVQLQAKVQNIDKQVVVTETGEQYAFDYLVLTMPVPQIRSLLADSAIALTEAEQQILDSIVYEPCWAVMGETPYPLALDGGLAQEHSPVAWLADNASKGITAQTTFTLHASAAFSNTYLEESPANVQALLLEAAQPWLGNGPFVHLQIHRWRYSLAAQRAEMPCLALQNSPIWIGGDAFGLGNVEGAFLSGKALADALAEALATQIEK